MLKKYCIKNVKNVLRKTQQFSVPHRNFANLLEHESKQILKDNGCTVQNYCIAEPKKPCQLELLDNTSEYLIKAQVPGGDRGRGIFTSGFRGGIHQTCKRDEAIEIANRMLGQTLVTKHTGPTGHKVNKVLIATHVNPLKHRYLCIRMDPIAQSPVVVQIRSTEDEQTHHQWISVDLTDELPVRMLDEIIELLDFGAEHNEKVALEIKNLWRTFFKLKLLLLEINPLILTHDGSIMCLDVNITTDDHGGFNENLPDFYPNYHQIEMGGDIGCLVNGAGLIMATSDLISMYGGHAGLCVHLKDVNVINLKSALKLIQSGQAKINAVLVNIAWPSSHLDDCTSSKKNNLDCKDLANVIIAAKLTLPLVVRLKGTNDQSVAKVIEESASKIYCTDDFEKACRKAVSLARWYKIKMAK